MQKYSQLTVYYDGACPLCSREVAWLMSFKSPSLLFRDISNPDISNTSAIPLVDLMKEIHATDEAEQLFRGMAAFRQIYQRIGLGWLLAPTAWPILRPLFDRLYSWFARNRLRLTGRGENCDCRR